MQLPKHEFYEVTVNGRTYARFVKEAHAKAFAKGYISPDLRVEIVPVFRVRL